MTQEPITSLKFFFILSLLMAPFAGSARPSGLIPSDFPSLSGPYLGQKPPDMTPEIFALGIISTEQYELNSVFSPDGTEFYYAISTATQEEKAAGKYFYVVMFTELVNDHWTKPKRASFSGEYMTVDIAFSPDGKRLYFCSEQSLFDSAEGLDIWYIERKGNAWSNPISLGSPVNSPAGETQPSFTRDGTLYFSSARDESEGVDIYYSRLIDGSYTDPIRLGPSINTPYNEGNSFIAPDESYLLFARWGMPEAISGGKGLYISFRNKNGSWSEAINTQPTTTLGGSLAALSPDGKFLFYSQEGDLYWVDAKIIEKLRPSLDQEMGKDVSTLRH